MVRLTHVSQWEGHPACATAECQECDWSARHVAAHMAVSRARDHACATGHSVELARTQRAVVTAYAPSDACDDLNPNVQQTWGPERAA
jgi:hypothetical protein